MEPPLTELTLLMQRASSGEAKAAEALFERVYGRLRAIAFGGDRGVRPGDTLQPTALVHEAYMKLFDGREVAWEGRGHFFGVAARAMRQIAVDHARARGAQKRGGGWARVEISNLSAGQDDAEVDLIALDEAMHELARLHPRQARIVELRFFGGLTIEETAQILDISVRSVQLDWRVARAWLRGRLLPDDA